MTREERMMAVSAGRSQPRMCQTRRGSELRIARAAVRRGEGVTAGASMTGVAIGVDGSSAGPFTGVLSPNWSCEGEEMIIFSVVDAYMN